MESALPTMWYITKLLVTISVCQALKLDPNRLCPPQYDTQGVANQVRQIERIKTRWESFQGIEGLESQVTIYKNKPVFKTKGNSLTDHLRSCTSHDGSLIEFLTAEQQQNVNAIMKNLKLDQILIYLTYSNGQLLWPSGSSFQYGLLDQLAKEKARAKSYVGMIQYKIFDKTQNKEVNEFSFTATPETLKSLCLANDNELYAESSRFKTEVQQEIEMINQLVPNMTELLNTFTVAIESSQGNIPVGTPKEKGNENGKDQKCWSLLIRPVHEPTMQLPPKVNSFQNIIKARQLFQKFIMGFKTIYEKLKQVNIQIGQSGEVQVEVHTIGMSFIANFSLRGYIYRVFFVLITIISILLTCLCCYCYCFLYIIAKVRDPNHARRINRHRPVEMIPLAHRRD